MTIKINHSTPPPEVTEMLRMTDMLARSSWSSCDVVVSGFDEEFGQAASNLGIGLSSGFRISCVEEYCSSSGGKRLYIWSAFQCTMSPDRVLAF